MARAGRAGRVAAFLIGCLALAGVAGPLAAAEIRVLTAGAFKSVVVAFAPAFEARTGHRLVIANDTAGGLARRIGEGEAFDLVVMPPGGLARLAGAGTVVADTQVPLARVGIGVAVRRGAPRPDIGTVDAFRETLRSSRRIAMIDPAAGGSSGVYLATLFERWGLSAEIASKSLLVPGGLVAERVVAGEADLALHQISEILAVPGAELVGPLPEAIQNHTVYAGAVAARAADPAAARALLDALRGTALRAILDEKGMQAP